ncbi:DUF2249 domain-containing protein [Ornithinimicrobium tianjinense]|uniref:DUF2249 domain-containing protein n=1 Tax=Ornithinimicrobium tianjinense TaxID=1195761 RepID=A0A917BXK2_9MICO|nr:DUF2249 domain-containing protein [Ornithinimicrobium tianjinense]GGF60472.1 hypothetical protein GCM10011366_30410 [Ornithinimicrobium tianjinense]
MSDQPTTLPLTEKKQSGCGCGCTDEGVPTLDARTVPHAIRHATIFGALAGLRAGQSMDLIAPHDPLPLLAQIAEREGDAVSWDYRERGPEAWTLRFTRA